MRTHTLLALILIFSVTGCSFYDSMSGHKPEAQDDTIDEPEPPPIHTYDMPLSMERVGTGLDLDTGVTDHWYNGPGECPRGMALVGWDLAAFEQQDLKINDRLGAFGTDLDGQPVDAPGRLMELARDSGVLVATDQGAVFRLTDARVYGPNDQQRFSVTAELVEPGICDPSCGAGRFDLVRIGRVDLELDQGLFVDTALALCGTPSDAHGIPTDLVLRPDTISAQQAALAFIPGRSFEDLHSRPDLGAFARDEVSLPLAESGAIVVETDEGRVYKLDPLLDDFGALTGFDFARL